MKPILKSPAAAGGRPMFDRRWLRTIVLACVALLAVTVVCATLAGGFDDKYNTFPIKEAEEEFKVSLKKETAAEAPVLKVIGPRKAPSGETMLYIVVVNPLDVPIAYNGYRMDAWTERPPPGEISPLYGSEIKPTDDANWKPAGPGWCGTGADEMVIRPGHAARFHVAPDATSVAQRINFGCTWKDKSGDTKTQKLSAEFKPVEGERKAE